jgi:hypothetical protein
MIDATARLGRRVTGDAIKSPLPLESEACALSQGRFGLRLTGFPGVLCEQAFLSDQRGSPEPAARPKVHALTSCAHLFAGRSTFRGSGYFLADEAT